MRTNSGLNGEVAEGSDLPREHGSGRGSSGAADLETLSTLSLGELRTRWLAAYGIEPLPRLSRELLVRGISYRTQERARGGLSRSILRKLEQIARGGPKQKGAASQSSIRPGTRLVRDWQGRVQEVVVLDAGFLWNGQRYASLSEIARLITGTRWSGPRFFGLLEHKGDNAR